MLVGLCKRFPGHCMSRCDLAISLRMNPTQREEQSQENHREADQRSEKLALPPYFSVPLQQILYFRHCTVDITQLQIFLSSTSHLPFLRQPGFPSPIAKCSPFHMAEPCKTKRVATVSCQASMLCHKHKRPWYTSRVWHFLFKGPFPIPAVPTQVEGMLEL